MSRSVLVVSAHAADFVWRAGGAIALESERGSAVRVVCLSFGERGESARLWREAGMTLERVKAVRRSEAEAAAEVLGAETAFLDAGDYPLPEGPNLVDALVSHFRETRPDVVLTHSTTDPYNMDHAAAHRLTLQARVLAQAAGYPAPGAVLGAPPVYLFEPHQPEMCGFHPDVLLDITAVFERKRKAMESMAAQEHLWAYYSELATRRGVQAVRNSGRKDIVHAEAFEVVYPSVVESLA